jgi:Flp pilus assembly pilin Flp
MGLPTLVARRALIYVAGMFEAFVSARLAYRFAAAKFTSGTRRAAERLSSEERGQDLIEYGGILILIAAIIAALFAIGIPGDISTFVKTAVNNIIGSGAASKASSTG